jgi:hypothetical protein
MTHQPLVCGTLLVWRVDTAHVAGVSLLHNLRTVLLEHVEQFSERRFDLFFAQQRWGKQNPILAELPKVGMSQLQMTAPLRWCVGGFYASSDYDKATAKLT